MNEILPPEETPTDNKEPRQKFGVDMRLFWIFLKVNLLTTAGPTSVGLLYKETVGKLMSEAKFVQAVGLSNLLPGSDALQLAMFIGYALGRIPGLLAALLGAILPPTILMFTVAYFLVRFEGQEWMSNFIEGMTPSIAVLLALVAWQLFRSGSQTTVKWRTVLIAILSFLTLVVFQIPPQYVLIGAGILGIFLFR